MIEVKLSAFSGAGSTMIPLWIIALLLWPAGSLADEIRPGYLSISEQDGLQYQVVIKLPMRGEGILDLYPQYPEDCNARLLDSFQGGRAATQYWRVSCQQSLQGRDVVIQNLSLSGTDVYLRYQTGESEYHYRLTPAQPSQRLANNKGEQHGNVWSSYILLGMEHILIGWDHLFFVLLLMFIMRSRKQLLLAVTGFTLAHSITLIASTLGWVNVPVVSVEILIAASIVFVAREIVKSEAQESLTIRYPLAMTVFFGLFHGLGFASVLQDIGLPRQSIPQALVSFNIGVEIGQLLFISAILLIQCAVFKFVQQKAFVKYASYGVGMSASYWVLARSETLLSGF